MFALAVGPCAFPLYVNVVVLPQLTAILFALIVHVLFDGDVWLESAVHDAV